MPVQETIAFIGGTEDSFDFLVEKLKKIGLQLLLICGEEEKSKRSAENPGDHPEAEIEFMTCPETACWEADIIILYHPQQITDGLSKKIREFATQKIILLPKMRSSDKGRGKDIALLEKKFPFSKIVLAEFNPARSVAFISAADNEAVRTISRILEKAGFETYSSLW